MRRFFVEKNSSMESQWSEWKKLNLAQIAHKELTTFSLSLFDNWKFEREKSQRRHKVCAFVCAHARFLFLFFFFRRNKSFYHYTFCCSYCSGCCCCCWWFFLNEKQIANSDATYGKSDKVMGQKRTVNRKLNQGMANPTFRMYAYTYTLTASVCVCEKEKEHRIKRKGINQPIKCWYVWMDYE